MSDLTAYVSEILTSAGTLITALFTPGSGETPAVLTAVSALPIVGGIIGIAVAATRKGKG